MTDQKILDLTDSGHDTPSPSPPVKRKRLIKRTADDSDAVADNGSAQPRKKRMTNESDNPPACVWPCSPDWPGVKAIGETLGVQYITAIDPGEVHMGAVRFQLYPVFRPTHWKIINLHELCTLRNELQPEVQVKHNNALRNGELRYGTRAIQQALVWYMQREMVSGGLFDSQMLFVESQDFRRDMSAIQACLTSIFQASRPPIKIHPLEGGARPAAQVVSGNSAKSCYAGMFPLVAGYECADEYEEAERTGAVIVAPRKRQQWSKKKRTHGFGDVQTASTKLQYESNKRNAKLYGPAVAHVERIREVMGSALSEADYRNMLKHIRDGKTDDIYDGLFIALYAINTHLYQMYRYKANATMRPLSATTAPPLRPKRQFEEVYELMKSMNAPETDIEFVRKALFKK